MNASVAPKRSHSKRNLAKLWLNVRMPLVAIIVLGTALGGGNVVWTNFQEAAQIAREEAFDQEVDGFFSAFSNPIAGYIKAADAAVANSDAIATLQSRDEAKYVQIEGAIRSAVNSAQGVRLVPIERRQPDDAGNPPITFATLDLARESYRTGEQPPVEVHLFGSPKEHLAVLRRVVGPDRQLLGHVLISFTLDGIRASLDAAPLEVGYAELSQRISGRRPLRLAHRGDVSLRGGVARRSIRLKGSELRVQVIMPSARDASAAVWGDFAPVLAGIALLVVMGAIGGVLALVKRRRAAGRVMLGGAVLSVEVDDEGPEGVFADEARHSQAEKASSSSTEISFDDVQQAGEPADPIDSDPIDPAEPALGEALAESPPATVEAMPGLADTVFRAYDIRGVVDDTLTADGVRRLGRAIGTEAMERGQQTLVVARDGRLSSDAFKDALVEGLTSCGRDVIDVGRVPTPVLYFATYFLNTGSGVMVTGSHNPSNYNGLKMMLGGDVLFGDAIQSLKVRAQNQDFRDGSGQVQTMDLLADYVRRVTEDMPVALGNALKVVVDCGNGAASEVAPKLIRALGHDVIELFCEVDGNFPNHHPDPSVPENLQTLIETVRDEGADIGLAFDGDGDRIGVVDDTGEIVWPDRLMMLFANDVLSRHAGSPIVFDVKSSSRLRDVIEAAGGRAIMDKTGHSYMRNKLHETGAQLAGELSGHIFFKERWYGFDDAMYVGARLLEILIQSGKKASEVFAAFPTGVTTPELRLDLDEGQHFAFMDKFIAMAPFSDGTVYDMDGVRVEYPDGWGLIRASNTTPSLSFRFEADDDAALARIQNKFKTAIDAVQPGLGLPF